jgi:ribonuclease HII
MAIELVTKFQPYVDEQFATESKKSLITNQDFDWTGAHTVKVYKVNTAEMNDYDRKGEGKNPSRYGAIAGLDATTEEMTLKKDRSFTFAIDKLDTDETAQQLSAASALARQNREVVIPEVDSYTYGVMCTGAGTKPEAIELTKDNIYTEIIKASNALDNAEVPETMRCLIVTPDTYMIMKQCKDITMETDIGNDMRIRGVIANLDGAMIIKVPAKRLPEKFGFMLAHPCACVAPTKLEDYKIHQDPPGISGALVEGRICYDAFVLENKVKAIYYQAIA